MSREIKDLHPNIREKCKQHIKACQDAGLNPVITYTWRSPREQDELYAKGRTRPGKIVTMLTGLKSKHCHMEGATPASKAYDIMIKNEDGSLISDGQHPKYKRAAELGVELGMECGFFWKSFFDAGHYQVD